MVLVLSLAVDPFLQAAVTISGKVTPVDGAGDVPTLPDGQKVDIGRLILTDAAFGVAGETPRPDYFRPEFDFGLSSAIYSSLGNSVRDTASSPRVSFQCSTGNCTWPAFTTLGVCSTCNDVTPILSKSHADNCLNSNGVFLTTTLRFTVSNILSRKRPSCKRKYQQGWVVHYICCALWPHTTV